MSGTLEAIYEQGKRKEVVITYFNPVTVSLQGPNLLKIQHMQKKHDLIF
jgi:hypothetical protein